MDSTFHFWTNSNLLMLRREDKQISDSQMKEAVSQGETSRLMEVTKLSQVINGLRLYWTHKPFLEYH